MPCAHRLIFFLLNCSLNTRGCAPPSAPTAAYMPCAPLIATLLPPCTMMAQRSETAVCCMVQRTTRDEEEDVDALRGAMCISDLLHPFDVHARDLAVHLPGWCIYIRDTGDGEDMIGQMKFTSFWAALSACARLNHAMSEMNCDTRGYVHVQPCPSHADLALEEQDAAVMSCAQLRAAAKAYGRMMHRDLTRPRTRAAVAAPPPAPAIITAAITAAWKELPSTECMAAQSLAAKATSCI